MLFLTIGIRLICQKWDVIKKKKVKLTNLKYMGMIQDNLSSLYTKYYRTYWWCGFYSQSEVTSASAEDIGTGPMDKDEVLAFPTNCYNCSSPTETRMKTVGIHNFCGLL